MIRKVQANTAYAVLCFRVKHLHGILDRTRLLGIQSESEDLFQLLTPEQKKRIMDEKVMPAVYDITDRLCMGELTPMMLQNKCGPEYTYYLRYLTDTVAKEDPKKARKLALEVNRDIVLNPNIENKQYWDEYFQKLLCRGDDRYAEDGRNRFLDAAIRR